MIEDDRTAHARRHAPTAAELLRDPLVRDALDRAWVDSLPADRDSRHEEGGWIYVDVTTGTLAIVRAASGSQAAFDVRAPPIIAGSTVVATFHTHPNPTAEGWDPRPSGADTRSAWLLGVPCLIRTDVGTFSTGPESRRGGFAGGPGYPPPAYDKLDRPGPGGRA